MAGQLGVMFDPNDEANLRAYAASLPAAPNGAALASAPGALGSMYVPDPNEGMTHTPGLPPLPLQQRAMIAAAAAPFVHTIGGLYDAVTSMPQLAHGLANEASQTSDPSGMISDTGYTGGANTMGALNTAATIGAGGYAAPKEAGSLGMFGGGTAHADDPLAALMAAIDRMPAETPVDLSEHVRPIDWQSYRPPNGAHEMAVPSPSEDQARALGYNTNVPLFKGMDWHAAPGEGLGDIGGFASPATKPNERAIFASDSPEVSQGYTGVKGTGYNISPMYARADTPYAVNWPDISQGGYDGTTMHQLIEHVRDQGGDALIVHGIPDRGGAQTQYAFMDPTKLRVRHAAFSPNAINSSNLLASQSIPILPIASLFGSKQQ